MADTFPIEDIRVDNGALARRLGLLKSHLNINLPEQSYDFDVAQTGQEIRVGLTFDSVVDGRMRDYFRGRLAWILESEGYSTIRDDLDSADGAIYVTKCAPVNGKVVKARSMSENIPERYAYYGF